MKAFFDRMGLSMEVEDLQRFAGILTADLGRALPGYELVIRLFDSPQRKTELSDEIKRAIMRNQPLVLDDGKNIEIPVLYQKRALALVSAKAPRRAAKSMDQLLLLPKIVELSLEKILLYKLNITDRESGLNNDYYFRSFIRRQLNASIRQKGGGGGLKPLRLGEKENNPGLIAVQVEIRNFDAFVAGRGRMEGVKALCALADRLFDESEGFLCMARLSPSVIGLLLSLDDPNKGKDIVSAAAAKWNENPYGESSILKAAFGLAAFPADFQDEIGQTENGDAVAFEWGERLLEKAGLALAQAVSTEAEPVFAYSDVLGQGGRIIQVMPYDRVIINLGRAVGAREGQVFSVMETEDGQGVNFKGEVTLFEVQQDYALGEILNLSSSVSRLNPGDRLVLSRSDTEAPAAPNQNADHLDPLLAIPDHPGFMSRLLGLVTENVEKEERFAVILIQMDGYDRRLSTMGRLESDKDFKALFDLAVGFFPKDALFGRFSGESLAAAVRDMDEDSARKTAEAMRDEIAGKLRFTASFGVATYPCGPYSRLDIVTNAQKALEHASFFGPASTAVFDSVSLNISGDKRFEIGDADGAIAEYNKALELNPNDLNVLNSLGVCYGHKKRIDLALGHFDRVLAQDAQNLMAHYNRGFVLAANDRYEEAKECFTKAAEIDDGHFDILYQLGLTELKLGRPANALASFEKAAALKNPRPIVFRYLGQTLLTFERIDDAVDAFKAAVRYDPEDAPSLSQLGILYLDNEGDDHVALSLIRQSVSLDPSNSLFRVRLAKALAVGGDLDAAEEEYLNALNLGVKNRETFYEMGLVLMEQGRKEDAREYFLKALDQDQHFKPALAALEHL